ncbi:CPBP family intramembrane glutamic endopeptidase [Companilactobacillus musae]|uniref:CPBP family intramembrane glutamic endopeptidase n=1 Tax=Companilactobacillus musae TaxID=1903258 RepID=UPI000E654C26|nr:CPBP family intramembrane glutamic endopeptidase [Companilactobacillus musae]
MRLTNQKLKYLLITTLIYMAITLIPIHIEKTVYLIVIIFLISCYLLKDEFKYYWTYLRNNGKKLWLIPVFTIADFLISQITANLFPQESSNEVGLENILHHGNTLIIMAMILLITVIGPLMEEIIFQYFIQGAVKKYLKKSTLNQHWISILAIIIATICFMLWHVDSLKDFTNLSFFTYIDLILYAIIYQLTDDNLLYPLATHIIWNTLGLLIILH